MTLLLNYAGKKKNPQIVFKTNASNFILWYAASCKAGKVMERHHLSLTRRHHICLFF